jgi:O-antigen ligase
VPGDKNESLVMGNVVEFVNSGKAKAALLAGEITQEEYDALVAMCQKLNNTATGGRMYLWSCALTEIKASPIFGNGLFSYQAKYNAYPHNFFLEIAADMGLPATLLILALGIYVFIQLLRMALINKEIMAFTLYVMTYLVRNMISSSAYSYETFVQYGFCILIVVWGRKLLKKDKK